MEEQSQNLDNPQVGDKIRIRSGPHTGARGIIQAETSGTLEIQLDESDIVSVSVTDVTNYSLAARRAWKTTPKRAGRPQLPVPRKRMVSMRLDLDVWDRLGDAVELGFIPSREEAVNIWLRERLDLLFAGEPTQIVMHE